jgi:hypothetical protein
LSFHPHSIDVKKIPHSNNVFQIFEFVQEGAFGAISGIWGIKVFTLD